jgi:hypothetical protein
MSTTRSRACAGGARVVPLSSRRRRVLGTPSRPNSTTLVWRGPPSTCCARVPGAQVAMIRDDPYSLV